MAEEYDVICNSEFVRSDLFRVWYHKRVMCPKGAPHEWCTCPFAHKSETASRRDPRSHQSSMCHRMLEDNVQHRSCPLGDACPLAHSVFEHWLHPRRYRTKPCNLGIHCQRHMCFFAHTPKELRTDTRQPALPQPYELTVEAILQHVRDYELQKRSAGHSPPSCSNSSDTVNRSGCETQVMQQEPGQTAPHQAGNRSPRCGMTAAAGPAAVVPQLWYLIPGAPAAPAAPAAALHPPPASRGHPQSLQPVYMSPRVVAAAGTAAAPATPPQLSSHPVYFVPTALTTAATTAARPPQPVLMAPGASTVHRAPPPPPLPPPPQHMCYYHAAPAVGATAASAYHMHTGPRTAVHIGRGHIIPMIMPVGFPWPTAATAAPTVYVSSAAAPAPRTSASRQLVLNPLRPQQQPSAADLVSGYSSVVAVPQHLADSCGSAAADAGSSCEEGASSGVWSSMRLCGGSADQIMCDLIRQASTDEERSRWTNLQSLMHRTMEEQAAKQARTLQLEAFADAAESSMTKAALDALAAMKAVAVKQAASTARDVSAQQHCSTATEESVAPPADEQQDEQRLAAAHSADLSTEGGVEVMNGVVAVSSSSTLSSSDTAAASQNAAATAAFENISTGTGLINGVEVLNGEAAAEIMTTEMNSSQSSSQELAPCAVASNTVESDAGQQADEDPSSPVSVIMLPSSQLLVVLPKTMNSRDVGVLTQAMMQRAGANEFQARSIDVMVQSQLTIVQESRQALQALQQDLLQTQQAMRLMQHQQAAYE